MTTKNMIQATWTLAGVLLGAAAAYADRPSWCDNGVLLDSRSYSDGAEARDFANSRSGSATINGVSHMVIGNVKVVAAPVGNRVYVVEIWDCPKAAPAPGGGPNGANNGGNNNNGGGKTTPEKITYTLDPHPELDRNGKRRVPPPPPPPPAPKQGAANGKSGGRR